MTWVKLDDGFAEHPKMEAVGPLGIALHVAALCYCARHLTDGHLPAAKVPRLLDLPSWKKVAASLVDAGAWDVVDGGYQLHDYLDYQPSKDMVEEMRAKKVEASVKGNHRQWHVNRNRPVDDCPLCVADGIAPGIAGGIPRTESPRPVPSPSSNSLHYLNVQGQRANRDCSDCLGNGWVIDAGTDVARRCACLGEVAS